MAPFRWSCVLVVVAALCGAAQAQRPQAAVQAPPQAAPGQSSTGHAPEMRIAAVVNDEVVSVFDLVSRMQMVMLSSNIPDTPELRERMGRQVLRSLIDEKLQLQEAKRQNVTVTDADVEKALQQIAQQNNMSTEQLTGLLKSRGIGRSALVDQVKATLVWAKLVRRQAAQTVDVSDEEIDEAVKRARENAKEPQTRIAEIFLAVDNPAQERGGAALRRTALARDAAGGAVLRRRAAVLAGRERAGRGRYGLAAPRSAASRTGQGGGAPGTRRPVGADPVWRRLLPASRSRSPARRGDCQQAGSHLRHGPGRLSAAAEGKRGGAAGSHRRGGKRTHRRQGLSDAAEDRQGKGAAALKRRQGSGKPHFSGNATCNRRIADRTGIAANRAKERRRRDHGLRKVDRPETAARAKRSPNRFYGSGSIQCRDGIFATCDAIPMST